jgi:uncharacterized protein YciI
MIPSPALREREGPTPQAWEGEGFAPLPASSPARDCIAPLAKTEGCMAQVIIRRSTIDLGGLPKTMRDNHARFLRNWREALVTFGPIFRGDAPAGYLYQTDLPGQVPGAVAQFMAEEPLGVHGVVESDEVSDWHCALPTRQATAAARPGLKGFFFHGTGKPGITELRNTIVPAHRAHLQQKDAGNCLSRGYLTDTGGQAWLGSAMVYEFESRAALDEFFRDEPYCTNGIYQKIDIYDWQRGAMG